MNLQQLEAELTPYHIETILKSWEGDENAQRFNRLVDEGETKSQAMATALYFKQILKG